MILGFEHDKRIKILKNQSEILQVFDNPRQLFIFLQIVVHWVTASQRERGREKAERERERE